MSFFHNNHKLAVFLLIVLSVLPLVDLFHPGLPITHDGPDHVARIANFYQSLSEGNIVPRWAGNLNWGYGHPILMFLYPFSSYLGSFFHALGFSLVDSVKLVFASGYLFSVITMYLWLSVEFGVLSGIVGAVLYGFAPYRFVDLYVRGAIGEHMAFIFPPLIFYGIFQLSCSKSYRSLWGILVSFAMAGLILAHNAISLMFLPFIFLYPIYRYCLHPRKDKMVLLFAFFYILFGFIISAFFWIPAFFEGKYTLRDILTSGEFTDRFVPWTWFFFSKWNYNGGNEFSKEVGLAQWLCVGGGIFLLFRQKIRTWKILLCVLLFSFFASLFLMTEYAQPIWNIFTILQKFQFPWRFLSISVFVTAVLGAIVVHHAKKKKIYIGMAIVSIALVGTISMWQGREYRRFTESYFTDIYNGTTDTGESSPIWSVRFMEKRAHAPMEAIDGQATIISDLKTTTKHMYQVSVQQKTRLVENTLYFPGWQILVDGRISPVEFQDPQYRGLMTFFLEPGDHTVVVTFSDTKVRMFANMLSVCGLGGLSIVCCVPIWKKIT